MVSLIKLYNLNESVFDEIKADKTPSKGDKGKDREKEFYFIDEPADPETGSIKSKVVYKRSFSNIVKDIEAETIDMKKLSDENSDDVVLYKISEELKELFNKFRSHVRKNYPEEYKKLEEEEIDENTLGGSGAGASFNAGNSMAYMGKNPFKKKNKRK